MSSGRRSGFWRTIVFRLTLWYSGVFLISFLLLWSISYFLLAAYLRGQDRSTIQLKLMELSASYRAGGLLSLERQINIDGTFGKRNPFLIRLLDEENRTLLSIVPYDLMELDFSPATGVRPVDNRPVWFSLALKGRDDLLEVAAIALRERYILEVGKSDRDRERVLERSWVVLAYVMIPAVLLSGLVGWLLGSRALRPVHHLNSTIRSVYSGKMGERVPIPRTGDELDELIVLFNAMMERIETLIRGMRGALDNVAHDLRTPLTRLRGIAEMALQTAQDGDSCRGSLAECLEESERIVTMLNTLMDISEAEAGTIKLNLETVNLSELIRELVELYAYVAEEKLIELQMRLAQDLWLTADANRMRQTLGNLLDNAVKYTPTGGRVEVEAHHEGSRVIVEVRDTGPGIPQEELGKIWERLYRCDQSRSQRGLGLGLSLVKAIVEAHGGRVDVASEQGNGSTFSLSFPVSGATGPRSSDMSNLSEL
jgi:heavy metal sensor kinase